MAHVGGGADAHAWFERDDSLCGKIDAKSFGDLTDTEPPELEERLISCRSKKNKVRDVDPTDIEPVPSRQTKRRSRLTEEESVGLNVSDDVVVYDHQQPKTDESRAAYKALLRTLNILARGAAIGKLITTDNQDNRGDVYGTSAADNGNTDDNDVGVAVAEAEAEAEDNEEEDDGSFYDALHEYALDEEVGMARVWCTRLARAENEEERKKIKKEMMSLGRPHTLFLKQLHVPPPAQLQMRSKRITWTWRKSIVRGSSHLTAGQRQVA